MRGKIFVAYHFEPEKQLGGLRIAVNANKDSRAPPDDRRFCAFESLKWWLWDGLKSGCFSDLKWLGVEQYRRQLDWRGRSDQDIDIIASYYDVITCYPPPGVDINMEAQYISCHGSESWDVLKQVLGPDWDYTRQLIPHGGLGTMRREVFCDYMSKWEEVFQEVAKTVKAPEHHRYQRRLFGFLAERFFALYYYRLMREHPETRGLFLPLIQGAQQHNT